MVWPNRTRQTTHEDTMMLTMDCPFCETPVGMRDLSVESIRCDACSIVVEFAADEPAAEFAAAA